MTHELSKAHPYSSSPSALPPSESTSEKLDSSLTQKYKIHTDTDPNARLSLGRKIWRFLTFYDWRHRVRTGGGVKVEEGSTSKFALKNRLKTFFHVPKFLTGGSKTSAKAPKRLEPQTVRELQTRLHNRRTHRFYKARISENHKQYNAERNKIERINYYYQYKKDSVLSLGQQEEVDAAFKAMDDALFPDDRSGLTDIFEAEKGATGVKRLL